MSEKTTSQPLTDEQLGTRDKRLLHEARLVMEGAKHVAEGRVQPTPDQMAAAHAESLLTEFEPTETSQRLHGHVRDLRDIRTRVGNKHGEFGGPNDASTELDLPRAAAATQYLQNHGIGLDLVGLRSLGENDQARAASATLAELDRNIQRLTGLRPILAENPRLRLGATVELPIAPSVSGEEGIKMVPSTIIDLRANGNFMVTPNVPSSGLPLEWAVSVPEVAAANPPLPFELESER